MKSVTTEHAHRPLDSGPAISALALRRIDPLRPLRDSLTALGLDGHVSIRQINSTATAGAPTTAFGLSWPLRGGSRAEIIWTASIHPFGDGSSLLSISVQAGAEDPAGCEQLLAAWPLISDTLKAHTARVFRAVTELTDLLTEDQPYSTTAPLITQHNPIRSDPIPVAC
jgi:hypothetical protein